jgi:tRNA modification GTPase
VLEGLHKISSADDTIVALSTPMGRSGIGVVRVSGSLATTVGEKFFKGSSPGATREAIPGTWRDASGNVIDEVVTVFFKKPHSYTGEDVLEVSAHGNPLILQQIICTIQSVGARLATPGEFTLRAVMNGKMDLIQAEAVRDFIEAQTEVQARTAMRQMGGALSHRIRPTKEALIGLIAHLEAGIDFAEDDVELPDVQKTAQDVEALKDNLIDLQRTYSYGRLLHAGVRLVIAGKPNVGKSSLFNRLVSADRAIVTELPGTTRDIISETTSVDGIPIKVFDTAGVRETGDVVEKIGVARALETVAEADFVLFVVDGSSPMDDADRAAWERVRQFPHLMIANKADLVAADDPELEKLKPIRVSARTGQGIETLRDIVRAALGHTQTEGFADSILTTARQNDGVLRAVANLDAARSALLARTPHEMVLLDLYQSLACLNELTGETTTEDILGRIFSTFCIGK